MLSRLLRSIQTRGLISTGVLAGQAIVNKTQASAFSLHRALLASPPHTPPTNWKDYENLLDHATQPTDINDHLHRLFVTGIRNNPQTIVELGVRGGESTRAFSAVADRTDADIVSVDIEDYNGTGSHTNWQFVQSDDVEFADRWDSWCGTHSVDPTVDLLFIDTSHFYEHTKEEIDAWFPKLAQDGVVIFHDTNLSQYYRRRDNSLGSAWDNNRGVIRALEDYFDFSFDEQNQFTTVIDEFLIEHFPLCNGLTILTRIPDR